MARANPKVQAALARHGFPKAPGPGLGFTPEDDMLLGRGWPALRSLTDETVPLTQARTRALEALDAIVPTLDYAIPRSVARLYLAGYCVGPNLFDGPNQPADNAARRARRQALLESPPVVDGSLFRATLREAHCQGMGDVYGRWRFAEVTFLYEAFLGTEVVARVLVERLLELAHDTASWGFAGEKPQRTNAAPHHLALVLPSLFQRLPPAVVHALRSELDAAPKPDPSATRGPMAYFELLDRLAQPDSAPRLALPEIDDELALRCPQLPALAARVEKQGVLFAPARVAWCLGTAAFAMPLQLAGHDAGCLALELGPLKDAGIVRLAAHLANQRTGRARAGEWLRRHASYTRPILESLVKLADKKEKAAATTALALLDESAPAVTETLSEEQVEAELGTLFADLGKELLAKNSKRARVTAIKTAHERYAEIRSAGGYPVPEAEFTHSFSDFGLEEWATLAVEAIG